VFCFDVFLNIPPLILFHANHMKKLLDSDWLREQMFSPYPGQQKFLFDSALLRAELKRISERHRRDFPSTKRSPEREEIASGTRRLTNNSATHFNFSKKASEYQYFRYCSDVNDS
jgi:hypothetical protein